MLKVSIMQSARSQVFHPDFSSSTYYVKDTNNKRISISVPERIKSNFHHQFERVSNKSMQMHRKHALSQIVGEAYAYACGVRAPAATEQLRLQYNGTEMVFYVKPETKSLFFNLFKNVRQDNYARGRWCVLSALVYYACLAAKP